MSEHRAVAVIPGDPDAVFAFLADVDRLPAYLPIVTSATRIGREDAVVGIVLGGVQSTHGVWVRAYRDRRQLAWGTVDNAYRGEVHVSPPRADLEASDPIVGDITDRGPVSWVTITLASERPLDGACQRVLDDAASALNLFLRDGADR